MFKRDGDDPLAQCGLVTLRAAPAALIQIKADRCGLAGSVLRMASFARPPTVGDSVAFFFPLKRKVREQVCARARRQCDVPTGTHPEQTGTTVNTSPLGRRRLAKLALMKAGNG